MDKDRITAAVRTMQMITFALPMGLGMFAAVTIVARKPPNPDEPVNLIITYVALAIAGVMILARSVVPRMIATTLVNNIAKAKTAATLPRTDAGADAPVELKFAAAYQTTLIIAHAMLEGPAFLLLASFMLEGQWIAFGGAAAIALLLLACMPTVSGVTAWIEQQQVRLRDEGSFDNWSGGESQPG